MPNLLRYVRPQRVRHDEHWQLNCDLMGNLDASSLTADVEIISLAYKIMKGFGAKDEDFVIKINDRNLLNDKFGTQEVIKLLDRKDKMPPEEFEKKWAELNIGPFDPNITPNENVKNILEKVKEA